MSGFTKLSSSLIASSVWNEPDNVRIVWVTMLAMANQNGDVKAAVPGLAHQARKSLDETQQALAVLESPDPHSGRPELEGRRIIRIEGGWHLVTHAFYREQGMSEETRKYWRERQRTYRTSRTVKDSQGKSRKRASVLGSVNASVRKRIVKEKPTQIQVEDYASEIQQPRADGSAMFLHWEENGWPKSWRLTMQKWKAFNYLPSQKQRHRSSNGSEQMSPQYRQNRINQLNDKKQTINRQIKDPRNPPSWAVKELEKIDTELNEL